MALAVEKADIDIILRADRGEPGSKILLIFPEGTRHHEGQMEQIENGASLIAMRTRAPIIPMYIDRKLSFFKVTRMYVGEPIAYDDLLEKGINAETCEEMNERFRETFRRMIAETEAASKKIKKN
jgi:1-acyl-sn-glycerol-3-phosphate acyltransferase